jgi:hypothetical protein
MSESRCDWCCIVCQSIAQRPPFCGNFFAVRAKTTPTN